MPLIPRRAKLNTKKMIQVNGPKPHEHGHAHMGNVEKGIMYPRWFRKNEMDPSDAKLHDKDNNDSSGLPLA